jgi:hypothetical protein
MNESFYNAFVDARYSTSVKRFGVFLSINIAFS